MHQRIKLIQKIQVQNDQMSIIEEHEDRYGLEDQVRNLLYELLKIIIVVCRITAIVFVVRLFRFKH